MRINIVILIVLVLCANLVAQHSFSNEVVTYPQWEDKFVPYAKGKIKLLDNGIDNAIDENNNKKEFRKLFSKKDKLADFIAETSSDLLQGIELDITKSSDYRYLYDNKDYCKVLSSQLEMRFCALTLNEENEIVPSPSMVNTCIRINDPGIHSITNMLPIVGDKIFLKPTKTGEFYGQPVYELHSGSNERVIVYKSNIPLWIPATREECLISAIESIDKSIKLNEEEMKNTNDMSIAEEFENGSAERQASLEEAYKVLLKIDPKEAEEFKKEQEKWQKEVSKELASDPNANDSQKAILMPGLETFYKNKKELEDELSLLTPTERKEQAYWANSHGNKASSVLFGLTKKSENAHPLVKVNPEVLRKTTDTDIWLITIAFEEVIPFKHDKRVYGKEGFMLAYQKQLEFANKKEIWDYVFNLVEK